MAKPDNWDEMSSNDQIKMAQGLINSTRGHLILGKALAHAIKSMSHAQHPELSDIGDMEILSVLFEPFYSMTMHPADIEAIKFRLDQAYKPKEN